MSATFWQCFGMGQKSAVRDVYTKDVSFLEVSKEDS